MAQSGEDPQAAETTMLAQAARSGDAEALTSLYEKLAPSLFAWSRLRITGRLKDVIEPEDIVQEVWCRALLRFSVYESGRLPFRRWVFQLANHVLMEAVRRAPTANARGCLLISRLDQIPDLATSVSGRVARIEGLGEVLETLASLDRDERRLLCFAGLEGLPHAETASRLGVGEDTVRKRWQRLRDRLRDMKVPDHLLET